MCVCHSCEAGSECCSKYSQSPALCWVALGKQRELTALYSDCSTSPLREKVKKGARRAKQIKAEAGKTVKAVSVKSEKMTQLQQQKRGCLFDYQLPNVNRSISTRPLLPAVILQTRIEEVEGWLGLGYFYLPEEVSCVQSQHSGEERAWGGWG